MISAVLRSAWVDVGWYATDQLRRRRHPCRIRRADSGVIIQMNELLEHFHPQDGFTVAHTCYG
jgi:hypothetical protein